MKKFKIFLVSLSLIACSNFAFAMEINPINKDEPVNTTTFNENQNNNNNNVTENNNNNINNDNVTENNENNDNNNNNNINNLNANSIDFAKILNENVREILKEKIKTESNPFGERDSILISSKQIMDLEKRKIEEIKKDKIEELFKNIDLEIKKPLEKFLKENGFLYKDKNEKLFFKQYFKCAEDKTEKVCYYKKIYFLDYYEEFIKKPIEKSIENYITNYKESNIKNLKDFQIKDILYVINKLKIVLPQSCIFTYDMGIDIKSDVNMFVDTQTPLKFSKEKQEIKVFNDNDEEGGEYDYTKTEDVQTASRLEEIK